MFPASSNMYERLGRGVPLCEGFLIALNLNLLKLKMYYILIACVHIHLHMLQHVCEVQRTPCRNQFSVSTVDPGTELKWTDVAGRLSHQPSVNLNINL